ncbi:ABC-type transporter, ATPase subunit [Corynebacterium glutamicum MB001]|uniref:ABC-type transporter, ATPase component n=1 Tax=Corynebacterium glutamicum (strain ATCC 13032 / DSM 20300 / JCM 1318 / BCRC 11384 / CCUG 27702 / LMG 3730 / NBRC 12168 / NCIMB 10025 / NRRL B-2784 / 534) TaxID=196627 RepID=Q8NS26_CORGL|nr:ABC transporter ATP-binding protein [Corynebacterium glutamicum]AGT04853.1 ABC-type transporter, ATPase subunit [Corynebacterium glutamicum MB001]ARV64954.1 macrolide ABC transporter ATP-binding protein [Corynebacterium glutamicum]ASW13562.1 ABC-type transporter, ATPase subunit [Corynebacterium glutamicum]AUI00427.1 ABC transporter ATP-binding protein [Corynebacterium glutamicum]AUI04067.1 ABC transporter ATP-binding protein [Corynebacterium glutamicum]
MTNTPFPLELQNISCAFGEGPRHVSALNNVSLAVNPGELVAIMGPSGSGKSTLLNVAGLLQRATSGHVLIDGASASDLNAKRAAETRRRHIGVIFQNYNLVPTLTVGENVGLPLELDGKTDRQAVAIALAEVGLEGFDDRFPEEISGGQAQRVAIARALIGPRKILLADEPTGALDTSTGDAVLRVLRQRIDSGAAGLLVTHEPRFAAWADRTIMLRDGEIQ